MFPSPVFPVMLSYLLWKARGRRLRMNVGEIQEVDVTPANHAALISAFARHVVRNGLSGSEKAGLLEDVAGALSIDYAEILRRRILQLMTPAEVGTLDQQLVS